MRVFITGVAGFIGSRIAEAMLAHGHEVAGIDNLATGRLENVPAGVAFQRDSILGVFPLSYKPIDVIYHCAATYQDRSAWETDAQTNVLGTLAVIRQAQRSGARVVYFQTSLCYGLHPVSPITVDAPLDPHGSYAVSKTAAESYIRDSGLDWVSLRLANMYGPRNLSGPVPAFWKRLTEGQGCTVVDARRDFVFVDDLVWVAVKAAEQGQGVYHVSSGRDAPIADVYGAVRSALGLPSAEPEVIPRGPDDVATLLLDPSQTEAEFGWTARTPLVDGIARAVEWYREHGVTDVYTHLAMKG